MAIPVCVSIHSKKEATLKLSCSLKTKTKKVSPCEGSVHSDLTAEGGAEAGDSYLSVLAVSIEVLQGAARVTLDRQVSDETL